MIGNIVKFFVAIGAIFNVIIGAVLIIDLFGIGQTGIPILIGMVLIGWGLFVLAGLSKLHEGKRR